MNDRQETLERDVVSVVTVLAGVGIEQARHLLTADLSRFKQQRDPIQLVEMRGLPQLGVDRGRIRTGSAGVVLECFDRGLPGRKYALKVQRPSLLAGERRTLEQVEAEVEALRTAILSHRNVGHLVGLCPLLLPTPPSGFRVGAQASLLEWLEAKNFSAFIYERRPDRSEITELFTQVMFALDHLHEKGLVHWDVKSANCLVTGDAVVKLMDIGNSREIMAESSVYAESSDAATSLENLPATLRSAIQKGTEASDSNRVRVPLHEGATTLDRPWVDLFMAGRMFGRVLGFEEEREKLLSARQRFLDESFPSDDDDARMSLGFFRRIVGRLTKAPAISSGGDAERDRYYTSAAEVIADLRKLEPAFGAASAEPELYVVPQHVIRLPVTRNTSYTKRVSELINSSPMKRLEDHLQLGLTRHAFPGARHVRFEHVVGVFHTTSDYIRALYEDRQSPDFRILCDSHHIRALLYASLVHDMGHGAFSHYLEECSGLFSRCSHEDYVQAVLRNDPALYAASGCSEEIIEDRRALAETLNAGWLERGESDKDFLNLVADILRPPALGATAHSDLNDRRSSELTTLNLLHSILDSSVDADKLDYLRRDAVHVGLDYGLASDVDRFLQSLTTALGPGLRPTIAVTEKGVLPVESLLVARHQMFNALYWQHTARAATAVAQYLAWRVICPRGSAFNRTGFLRRRGQLLTKFRELPDVEALDWLAAALRPLGDVQLHSLPERARGRIGLPVPVCDVTYSSLVSDPQVKYKHERVITLHALLNEQAYDDYADARTEILSAMCANISAALSGGKRLRLGGLRIDETAVFPDVPLGSKDQIEDLYVVSRTPSGNDHHVTDFNLHSPMAEAIQDAFRVWSRRLRIFVLPELQTHLLKLAPPDELASVMLAALHSAYESVAAAAGWEAQQQLPFEGVVKSGAEKMT